MPQMVIVHGKGVNTQVYATLYDESEAVGIIAKCAGKGNSNVRLVKPAKGKTVNYPPEML